MRAAGRASGRLPPHLRAPPAGRPIPRRGAGRSATGRSPAGLARPRRAVRVRPPRSPPRRRGLLCRRSRPLRFATRRGAAPARHSDRTAPDPRGLPSDPRRRRYVRRGGVAPQLAGVRGRGRGPERAGRDPARPAPGRPPRHRDESPRSAASEKPMARVVPPRGRRRALGGEPGRPYRGHRRARPHVPAGQRPGADPHHLLRCHRGHGVGERAAVELFNRLPGPWEVRVLDRNTAAQGFWRTVIARYTHGDLAETTRHDSRFSGIVYHFDSTQRPGGPGPTRVE